MVISVQKERVYGCMPRQSNTASQFPCHHIIKNYFALSSSTGDLCIADKEEFGEEGQKVSGLLHRTLITGHLCINGCLPLQGSCLYTVEHKISTPAGRSQITVDPR